MSLALVFMGSLIGLGLILRASARLDREQGNPDRVPSGE